MSNSNIIRFPVERTKAAQQAMVWLDFDAARKEWLKALDAELVAKALAERGLTP